MIILLIALAFITGLLIGLWGGMFESKRLDTKLRDAQMKLAHIKQKAVNAGIDGTVLELCGFKFNSLPFRDRNGKFKRRK